MLRILGAGTLATGEKMTVKLIMPPEQDYAGKIYCFLEHKSDLSRRSIQSRLRGDYSGYCVDKYFVGEINGRIAGQLWYGYATSGTGISNFGHVYTEPEHRKKGITDALMRFFMEDFQASPAQAALCGTGSEWVANIYKKFGFQTVGGELPGALILVKKEFGHNFTEFAERYFTAGQDVSIIMGTMEHRHDADLMLRNATTYAHRNYSQRVNMAFPVSSYENAWFRAEDGHGMLTVAVTKKAHVIGWAFFLNTGSSFETDAKVFDFEIHPNYDGFTECFVRDSLKLAREKGINRVYAYQTGNNRTKISCLEKVGFRQIARLKDYLATAEGKDDLVVLATSDGAADASEDTIKIRGEHLTNLRNYVVEKIRMPYPDYGVEFQKKHDAFLTSIVENPQRPILLVADTDDLCDSGTCLERKGDWCRSDKLIRKDMAVAAFFGLVVNCRYKAEEVIQAVSRPAENFKEALASIVKELGLD